MNVTAAMALKIIPQNLTSQPDFCVSMIQWLQSLVSVPVWNKNRVHYLSIPLSYRMWQKKESKLKLAASMVRQVMPESKAMKNVTILCISIVDEYEKSVIITQLCAVSLQIFSAKGQ